MVYSRDVTRNSGTDHCRETTENTLTSVHLVQ